MMKRFDFSVKVESENNGENFKFTMTDGIREICHRGKTVEEVSKQTGQAFEKILNQLINPTTNYGTCEFVAPEGRKAFANPFDINELL